MDNRVGVGTGNPFGYADAGFSVTFTDAIVKCLKATPTRPQQWLSAQTGGADGYTDDLHSYKASL